jgi:PAS domain S-box-containing protein
VIGNWKHEVTQIDKTNDLSGRSLQLVLVSECPTLTQACLDSVARLEWQAAFQPASTELMLEEVLRSDCWDLVILDLRIVSLNADRALARVRALISQCPVVLICDEDDEVLVADLIRAGATTFLLRRNLHKLPQVCKKVVSSTSVASVKEEVEIGDAIGILKALLQEATDSIVVKDAEGRYLLINPAGARFLGRDAEEIIGKTDFELFTPETAQRIAESDRHVMLTEKTQIIEDLLVPLAGETRTFQAMKCVYRDEHGRVQGIINVVRDITLRKQAEDALKESEQRFRMMADAAPVLIWMTDDQGMPNYFNRQWLDFTGQNMEEALAAGWYQPIHPDDCITLREEMEASFVARQPLKLEFRLRRGADGKYLWILTRGVPRFNPDGSFAGYIGSCVNIHDQKMAQKELSDYAVKLYKSNQELEQFATVASHDLQAPLRKVIVFSDALLSASEELNEENRDYLQRMQRATRRMQDLITDLLNLSRINRKGQPFTAVSLRGVAEDVVADLFYEAREMQGGVELGDLDIMLDADPVQLQQLLQNLIENGLKFHRKGVPPRVKVSAWEQDHSCWIQVEDNGIGFDEKHAQRIFGVFERLHGADEYEGTGIGLAICKKIVERHGGDITAYGAPGQGARFVVMLPLKHEQ